MTLPRPFASTALALSLAFASVSCRGTTPPQSRSADVTHDVATQNGRTARAHDGAPEEIVPAPTRRPAPHLPEAAAREEAPELDGGIAWLNTDRPLRLSELRGQVVLVDFWTYCCINCMHTLPVLAQIEQRHARDPVAVIGVHSAKFPGEREADRIAEAIGRYEIHHPVVVDQENAIWDRWHVNAWPSVFVIDTHGRIVGLVSGEPNVEGLDAIVNALLEEGRGDHSLAASPVAIHRPSRPDTGPLAYPGKVVSLGGDRIAFSDSGHDRIVVAHTDGRVEAIIGQGIPGSSDGDFEHARFHHPQGVAIEPPAAANGAVDVLYVADTENHQIRRVDLARQQVTTLAGAGVLGRGVEDGPSPARTVALRSPWDLARVGDTLYVAMAGSHQIWAMRPDGNEIAAWAGNGREARHDGIGMDASFAQPSGLASDGNTVYVADSETSSVRAIDLATRNVRTLVGQDLFVFGDVDGDAQRARLQHPLGVAVVPGESGVVYVADTYNHKIKRIDVASRTVRTLAGANTRDPFFEPSGLAWTGREFVVTDTNHHRLVRMSRDGRTVTPIVFRGLAAPVAQVVDAR
jgi:thiol-disulfide isomerase/thioredoxin/sugar lactone lactonase YvrE